ncbi:uncharacterized protein LOC110855711 isoform X2 [Folsomia candida]|uniref:uncharacterized protein LOC110855711 isoform X2 n=1 Tax=Folsomia candida TaxID=158441 RepID=UPI00160558B6|nr:uncharacterized protein LOC110855711 isoform X2 [Folsomia candida]
MGEDVRSSWLTSPRNHMAHPSDEEKCRYFMWVSERTREGRSISTRSLPSGRHLSFSEFDKFELATRLNLTIEGKRIQIPKRTRPTARRLKKHYVFPAKFQLPIGPAATTSSTRSISVPLETNKEDKGATDQPNNTSPSCQLTTTVGWSDAQRDMASRSCLGIAKPVMNHLASNPHVEVMGVRRIQPWPLNAFIYKRFPIFEDDKLAELYAARRCEMRKFYSTTLRGKGKFPLSLLEPGVYVVYQNSQVCLSDDKDHMYERAKVLTIITAKEHPVTPETCFVRLYLLDQGTVILARPYQLYFLFEEFNYPPRALYFTLLGIHNSFYMFNAQFEGLLSPYSAIWSGPLIVHNLPENLGCIIFSPLITIQDFRFGIAEYILRRLAVELYFHQEKNDLLMGEIVYNEKNCDLWFQIKSPFSSHRKQIHEVTRDFWKQESAEPYLEKGTIVMAPHEEVLYRARVERIVPETQEVHVFFLDYGNKAIVPIQNVSLARNFHPVYEFLPQTVLPIKLANLPPEIESTEVMGVLFKFIRGLKHHYAKIVDKDANGALTVQIVKPQHRKTCHRNLFDLSLPHFALDWTDTDSLATGKAVKAGSLRDCSEELDHIPHPFSYFTRFDCMEPYLSPPGMQIRMMQPLFLRPQNMTWFYITNFDSSKEIVMARPAALHPELMRLEHNLDLCYYKILDAMSDFNVEKIWEPGLNCSVKSKTLKKVVRAQVIGTDGEEKLNVVLVDYGIRESCYMISLAFLTWEQGQLPACGFEGTLKINSRTDMAFLKEIEMHENFLKKNVLVRGKVNQVVIGENLPICNIEVQEFTYTSPEMCTRDFLNNLEGHYSHTQYSSGISFS